MREDVGQQSVWRLQGRRWRTFAYVFLPFTSIFLLATLLVDDLHWGTRSSAVFNVIAGMAFMVTARTGTSADANGVEVTNFRTRRIPWAAVEELRLDIPSRWATSVEARLADGSILTLSGVPPTDLPRLEQIRAAHASPPELHGLSGTNP